MAVWSTIRVSETRRCFGRLDSEFYKPEFLALDQAISNLSPVSLRQVMSKLDVGHVGPMVEHYSKEGILFLQTQNIKPFFIDLTHSVRIDSAFHEQLPKSQVRKGNVLLARSGSFGTASIYLDDDVVNAADIIIVDLNKQTGITPLYFVAFLNSKYGVGQLLRFASGGVQGHVNLRILESFKIPTLEKQHQDEVGKLVLDAYKAHKKSGMDYSSAQTLLSSALKEGELQFERPLSYTTKFSNVMREGRADADYFQVPYVQLAKQIRENAAGFVPLTDYCAFLRPNANPDKTPNEEFSYVELADIHAGLGVIDACGKYRGGDLPSRARRCVMAGDVLASSVVGSIDKSAVIGKDQEGFIASTGFFHLRPKGVPPEFLLLLMRSKIVQMQLRQQATGGILSGVPDARVKYIVVPKVKEDVQKAIAAKVRSAHGKHRESLSLLAAAKARVEELVEAAAK